MRSSAVLIRDRVDGGVATVQEKRELPLLRDSLVELLVDTCDPLLALDASDEAVSRELEAIENGYEPDSDVPRLLRQTRDHILRQLLS